MTTSWGRRLAASFYAALASVAAAHAANLLGFFVLTDGQFQTKVWGALAPISYSFALPSLFALIVVMIAAFFGGFRTWWSSLVSAVAAAFLGVIGSGLVQFKSATFTQFGSLATVYFIFIVAVVFFVATLGRRVFDRSIARRRTGDAPVALVRIPAQNLAEGVVTNVPRTLVDRDLADKQWDAYVEALTGAGWQTVEVAPADRLADSVFVEDAAIVLSPSVALITRPGAPSRLGETAGVADSLRERGFTLYEIEAPGTIDGGDVLIVGRTVYVGRSGRTTADGVRQLREVVALTGLDLNVVAVPVTGALHLKSVASALPDGTVLVYGDAVDARVFERVLVVPEASGANVVPLSAEAVLMAGSAPQSAALVEDLGYRVVTVDLSEFEKLEGSATCLSVRL